MKTQGLVVLVGVLALGFAGASLPSRQWVHTVAVAARTTPEPGADTVAKQLPAPSSAAAPALPRPNPLPSPADFVRALRRPDVPAVTAARAPESGTGRPVQRRDLRALMGPVRTMPVTRNGKIEGFRVSGMRPGTLLPLLGIQNGDVIESFDGKDVSTPERALEAYAVLMDRSSERLFLGIRRRGAPLTITYRIN